MKIEYVEIESIEEIQYDDFVYDMETDENNHMFFANDILVHNSTHISIKPILDLKQEPILNEEGNLNVIVYDIANEFNKHLNGEINKWSTDVLNSSDSRFYFKREAICSTGLYQSKKHYILHIRDKGEDKPMPCDKIKPVGVEIVKSTMSEKIKNMLRDVVKVMLNSRDREQTLNVYRKIYEEFKKLPVEEIAFRSGIKTYDKYASQAVGFSKAKRTPAAVAGALYHNNMLKEYNITGKYDELKSEDRVKWIYCLSNNKYNISNIAFADMLPTEFVDIQPDYDKMFKTLIEPAVQRLFECAKWKMVNLQAEYTVDLLDFFKE